MTDQDQSALLADDARKFAEAIRNNRNEVFRTCIAVCEEFAADQGSARQCVMALEDMFQSMNDLLPAPSKGN